MADCYWHGQSFSGPCDQCTANRAAGLTDGGKPIPDKPIPPTIAAPLAATKPAPTVPASEAVGVPVALRYRKNADDVWSYSDIPSKGATLIASSTDLEIEYLAAPAAPTDAKPVKLTTPTAHTESASALYGPLVVPQPVRPNDAGVRDQALEEAAQWCDDAFKRQGGVDLLYAAQEIRALKSSSQAPENKQ